MMNENENDEKDKFWLSSDWECISYGNKEMSEWYREYLKRREEGTSMEFYDVLSSYINFD
jgi:hypothetical protein